MDVVRRGARFLAPLALILTMAGVYLLVHRQVLARHTAAATVTRSFVSRTTSTVIKATPVKTTPKPSVYVVRAGDTMSAIADKAGISLSDLESLNPNANPNALQTGQRLRLR
jgi:LysM repeat protein